VLAKSSRGVPAIHLGSLRIDSRSDVKSSGSAATNQTFKRFDTLPNEFRRLSYFPHCIFRETIIATSSAATGRPCILMRGKATTSLEHISRPHTDRPHARAQSERCRHYAFRGSVLMWAGRAAEALPRLEGALSFDRANGFASTLRRWAQYPVEYASGFSRRVCGDGPIRGCQAWTRHRRAPVDLPRRPDLRGSIRHGRVA